MNKYKHAFFFEDDDYLVAHDAARGPWSADACHAGPVSGLLARAAESQVSDKQLVRLSANFVRPVPMSGIRIECEVLQNGRIAAGVSVTAFDRSGKVCVSATTTHIVVETVDNLLTPDCPPPPVSDEEPYDFIVSKAPHGQRFISNFVETRYSPDSRRKLGPNTLWMRTPPLLATEDTSRFQQVCTLADCGNAISCNHKMTEVSCVNPDITIALHRLPESDWLASKAISHWQQTGIGLSHATLFDEVGEIGYAIQSLVLRRI
jgi:acyl-CoA thioesterase